VFVGVAISWAAASLAGPFRAEGVVGVGCAQTVSPCRVSFVRCWHAAGDAPGRRVQGRPV